jgi:hypothetical protein
MRCREKARYGTDDSDNYGYCFPPSGAIMGLLSMPGSVKTQVQFLGVCGGSEQVVAL